MNNFWQLVKVDFLSSFNIRGSKKKTKATSSSVSFKAIIGFTGILAVVLSVIYNVTFVSLFAEGNAPLYYPMMLFAAFTSILTLSTSVFKVKSIFMGKDYQMLSAMPIRKTEIIASKIVSLYLVELFYSAVIMIPNMIITIIFSLNFWYLLTGILATFLIPAIPMMVACLVAMFISLIADRSKFGNVFNVIFYLIFFIAIFAFSFLMNTGNKVDEAGNLDVSMYVQIASVAGWINPTVQLLGLSISTNPLFSLLFILANVVFCAGVVAFIALLFDKVYEIINTEHGNEKYVAKNLQSIGSQKALFKNEAKRYFSTKYYFINSISSGIVALVMAVMLGLMFSPWVNLYELDNLDMFSKYGYVGFLIVAFGLGIATPASVAISIEGNNFWLIKSLPIDYKQLIKAKVLLSVLVLGSFAVVASIVFCILIQASVLSFIITPLLSLAYVCLTSVIGIRINLTNYKLKWKNEMEVVKNSSAVILAMLADWGITLVLAGSVIGLSFVNEYLSAFTTLGILVVLSLIMYKSTVKKSNYFISKIENF